ncbi:MAG: hypothetical protein ACTHL3_05750 [Candidatus Nitrosocosmicus sp.]
MKPASNNVIVLGWNRIIFVQTGKNDTQDDVYDTTIKKNQI